MNKFSIERVMNSETIWCIILDDYPIGTATWKDGIANATVVYNTEIKYFNSDVSLGELIAEVSAHVRKVNAHYNDLADAEQDKAEYYNIAANYDKLADDEAVTPMGHTERKSKDGRVFGGWALR